MSEEINLNPILDWRHKVVRTGVLAVVEFFYPNVKIVGQENIPPKGQPVIYVLNHPNFLLDRVMLTLGLRRRISCMGKSTFYSHPISRLAMETFGGLPVYRKVDDGLPFGPRGDAAKRNKQVLTHCRNLLHHGDGFALFPEGTTHSEPELLPLQSGAARIALEAESEANWQREVWIVPVGVWYEDKTRFRSSGCVAFGTAVKPKNYEELYKKDVRQAIKLITAETTDGLRLAVATANISGHAELSPTTLATWQTVALSLFLLLTSPLAALGFALHYIPYRLTVPLVLRFFDKRDTRMATGKMLANMLMLPLNWLMWAMVGAVVRRGWLMLFLTPLLGYFAVRWVEAKEQIRN